MALARSGNSKSRGKQSEPAWKSLAYRSWPCKMDLTFRHKKSYEEDLFSTFILSMVRILRATFFNSLLIWRRWYFSSAFNDGWTKLIVTCSHQIMTEEALLFSCGPGCWRRRFPYIWLQASKTTQALDFLRGWFVFLEGFLYYSCIYQQCPIH